MPADAVLFRAMLDIQTSIQGAITGGTLQGLSTANVVIEKIPSDRKQPLPAVVIAPYSEEMPARGVTDRDDVTYNVLVALLAADNQDQSANFEQELNWRQNIRRLFHFKRLGPQTTESVICRVKPLTVIEPDAWYANLFLSMLLVACECREARTQG